MSLLTALQLCKTYQKRPVVSDVSITVNPGEIVGLLGPNGAGKTTTFYMIAGLVQPDKGKVMLADRDVTRLPMHRRAQLGLGYLPQEDSVFRNLSVLDNLMAILETRRGLSSTQRRERAEELLQRFGIAHLSRSLAITLSGGEKRRLAIARCLCTNPSLLMLDEPFAGVDPKALDDIKAIITQLREVDGLSILITDHSVRETLSIVDNAYLIYEGKVIFHGNSNDVANDPLARKYYLGDQFVM